MTLTSPLHMTNPHSTTDGNNRRKLAIFFSRLIRLSLLFAYTTAPMWTSWFMSQTGYRNIAPEDMLLAMGWLPISAAIIGLSFMKFSWQNKLKGTLSFIFLNAAAISVITYFVKL